MKPTRRKFLKGVAGIAALSGGLSMIQCSSENTQSVQLSNKQRVRGPAKEKYDAIVVGAGLSGLNAAILLEEAGYDVLVLEGRNRLGGRVYTLEHVPGKPEAAGEYIGANYARMINMVHKMDLKMYNPEINNTNRPWMYQIKGEWIDSKSWASHKFNPLKGDDRELLPHRYLSTLSNRDNPLKDMPLDAWLKEDYHQFDIPHDQYLRSKGLDEDTIRLMNVVIHSGGIANTSAINELRRYHVMDFNSKMSFPDGKSWKMVEGGNSQLPRRMAGSLSNEVLLNKTVVGFSEKDHIVEVACTDGSIYKADHVVCSIPISVLRNVTFEPRIEGITEQAIDQIDYGLSVQAHFLVKDEYWEKDGMEPNMWTDGPLERVALRNRTDKNEPRALVVFINGPESLKFRLMTDEQVFAYVEKKLVEMRPSMEGVLEPLLIQSCERDIHGAGDWVYWQPGQVKKFANHMRLKHGNIHFCGEHTAIMERGMEGAFESGERAAMEIILQA